MKLKIEEKRWLNGTNVFDDSDGSALYRPGDRKMCCLGFYGRKLGMKVEEISSKMTPEEILSDKWPEWLVRTTSSKDENTNECSLLMSINDATHYNPDWEAINAEEASFKLFHKDDRHKVPLGWKKLTMPMRKKIIAKIFKRNGVEVEFI